MKMEELERIVDDVAVEGLMKCGCYASPQDRVYYAAQALFPDAGEEAWALMTSFAMSEGEGTRGAEQVVVAIYEHRYGQDVVVFRALAQAQAWKKQIAQEWWDKEFDTEPPPDDEIADEYFDRIGEIWGRDEYFNTYACDVKGD